MDSCILSRTSYAYVYNTIQQQQFLIRPYKGNFEILYDITYMWKKDKLRETEVKWWLPRIGRGWKSWGDVAQRIQIPSYKIIKFGNWTYSLVQLLGCVRLFATAAHQASLSITNSQSLLKLMSITSVMPSNHLILCHPLLLRPSIFPSIRVFSNESVLRIRWLRDWSFSFSISPSNEYSGLISFRIDWLDLLAVQGTLKSLFQHHSSKASILWCSAFFIVQLSQPYMKVKVKSLSHVRLFATLWTVAHQAPQSMEFFRQEYWSGLPFPSPEDLLNLGIEPGSPSLQADALLSEPPGNLTNHPYMTTGKTIALTRRIFVGKVMSLLFNILSRLVIGFLPRSKHLLISWLQSPSAVILKPPKIKFVTVSIVSPSICHDVIGPDARILVFWILSFKPTISLSSFTFLKRLFSSSLLAAIRVVSSAYLRLLIFLPAILIPAYISSSPAFVQCGDYS